MFKYNNNHIFTGYLKQLLSTFNLPACKVYTQEYADYLKRHGQEDPRVIESFESTANRPAVHINYLKNSEIFNYLCKQKVELGLNKAYWKQNTDLSYDSGKNVLGLTRTLNSPGLSYDTKTHEYLGDYLRFLRDYYNLNLMSLYNCFTNKSYDNIEFDFNLSTKHTNNVKVTFYSNDARYRIYAIPVKLFAKYTIAIDCNQGIELFCGLYNTKLDTSKRAETLAIKTYKKVQKALFNQPFIYDSLEVGNWPIENEFSHTATGARAELRTDIFTRWDIINREKDLKLFIKVPTSCRSTITILEGDFSTFNNARYIPDASGKTLTYLNNHSVLNFSKKDKVDLNNYTFTPISRLQLLALNTGESYPFADRLVEYLSGSAITPIDEIPDNIKRVQRVMKNNGNYFKIEGLWENKMQNLIYDYVMNSGPVIVDKTSGKLVDRHQGYHQRLGHSSKSALYDVLGYVDKDAENWYASWKKENNNATVSSSLQSVDIYEGLYDI